MTYPPTCLTDRLSAEAKEKEQSKERSNSDTMRLEAVLQQPEAEQVLSFDCSKNTRMLFLLLQW